MSCHAKNSVSASASVSNTHRVVPIDSGAKDSATRLFATCSVGRRVTCDGSTSQPAASPRLRSPDQRESLIQPPPAPPLCRSFPAAAPFGPPAGPAKGSLIASSCTSSLASQPAWPRVDVMPSQCRCEALGGDAVNVPLGRPSLSVSPVLQVCKVVTRPQDPSAQHASETACGKEHTCLVGARAAGFGRAVRSLRRRQLLRQPLDLLPRGCRLCLGLRFQHSND
jgi:hypothetical protein